MFSGMCTLRHTMNLSWKLLWIEWSILLIG
uniref:Uncharacterized protein n=1 Tax=Rhizophora mucronata TaxID=61149 RepID=A0A2P2P996_RHIMU